MSKSGMSLGRGTKRARRSVTRMAGDKFRKQLLQAIGQEPGAVSIPGVSKYRPHQNARQRARYAWLVAAGKLNMEISQ